MFSYRHGFHAGNHADVLKHVILLQTVRYLLRKDTPLTVIDTHAGTGIYRLDSDYAQTSQESDAGIAKLWEQQDLPEALTDYLDCIHGFNPNGKLVHYPGSPLLLWQQLGVQDKLHLYELHPTDQRALKNNVSQLQKSQNIEVHIADGFSSIKKHLPPASRRGLVLMDPSYEVKTDYHRVPESIAEALKLFATGVYLVWYPIVPIPIAHQLPGKLKRIAESNGRTWLNATLKVRNPRPDHKGLIASGMFVINPPHILQTELQKNLAVMVNYLGQDKGAEYTYAFKEGKQVAVKPE